MTDTETVICHICNIEEPLIYNDKKNEELKVLHLCFTCDFWTDRIEKHQLDRSHRSAIINGVAYMLLETPKKGGPLGHGGTKMDIRFHDNVIVQCSNVWCQGVIPERFRDHLRDNARAYLPSGRR